MGQISQLLKEAGEEINVRFNKTEANYTVNS